MIVFGSGQEAEARLLTEELSLIGLTVRQVKGDEKQAESFFSLQPEHSRPNVVMSVQRDGINIWVIDSASRNFRAHEPVRIRRESGESTDSHALRSVELLRGQLLEGESSTDGQVASPDRAARSETSLFAKRVSVTGGPTIQIGSYSNLTWGFAVDAAVWFGSVGVGPWVFVAPSSSTFRPAPKPEKLSVTQTSLGIQLRGLTIVSSTEFFAMQILGRLGWRHMTFSSEKGKEEDRFRGSSGALVTGLGADFSFKVTTHFRLRMMVGADMGVPLLVPEDGPEPGEPANKVPQAVSDAQEPDFLVWTSGSATFQF